MGNLTLTDLACAGVIAVIIVFVIHCNIWYYSHTPEEREEMDKDYDEW